MKRNILLVLALLACCTPDLLFAANPNQRKKAGESTRERLRKRVQQEQQAAQLPLTRIMAPTNPGNPHADFNRRCINFKQATDHGDWKTAFTILNNTKNRSEQKTLLLTIDDRIGFNALFDAVSDASLRVVTQLVPLYRAHGINLKSMCDVTGHNLLNIAQQVDAHVKPRQPIIQYLQTEIFFDEVQAAAAEEAAFAAQEEIMPSTTAEEEFMRRILEGNSQEEKQN